MKGSMTALAGWLLFIHTHHLCSSRQLILLKKERLVLGEWVRQQTSRLSAPQVCSDSQSLAVPGPTTVQG